MAHSITVNVIKIAGELSIEAQFPDELSVADAVIALESAVDFIRAKVDAKARVNGFGSAMEAPIEFTAPLTFSEIIN